jgi:hypothetical protein
MGPRGEAFAQLAKLMEESCFGRSEAPKILENSGGLSSFLVKTGIYIYNNNNNICI